MATRIASRGSPGRSRGRPASCRGHSRSARSSRRGGALRLRLGAGERDEILGAALRRLEVPTHRPGFHAELRAKLGTAVPEADTAHRERATRPRRVPPRRGQARHPLRWTIGLTAAAAAAAVAVAVAAPGLFTGGPAPASAQSARRILLTAAESAARAPVTTGRYWFTDQELGGRYLVKGRGGPYVIEFRKEHRDWTNGHSPNRTHAQGDVQGQFAIPGPVAAVSAAGDGVAGETQFMFTT